ncbi:MAG TPA: SigE family RNA polymerase sigma factor [Acidimicrobiia bacterium]|nr:SigE family RNA polymerase sigma factor [Acidimicrobiia bacterium]
MSVNLVTVGELTEFGPVESEPSFDELFETHYRSALRLAVLLVGDQASAEDLVADAYVRVYVQWRRGRVSNVEAYLRRAVVNAVKNAWRRRSVARRFERLVTQSTFDADPRALDTLVVERDELLAALHSLPPGQRQCIVLRYYEDLSEAQTAAMLGIAVGTVKSQTAKGLARLASIMEGGAQR